MRQSTVLGKIVRRFLRDSMYYETFRGTNFLTFKARPKFVDMMGVGPFKSPRLFTGTSEKSEPTAIVLQGPIAHEEDFTAETCRIYAETMPDCQLILSTWKDTPEEELDVIRRLGVDVVVCEKPTLPGLFNVNMQIASAAAGVKHAVDCGAQWVLKSRTDHRLYFPESLTSLVAMAKSLPPTGDAAALQRYRIFGIGLGNLKFGPYHVTDQTVFGHADDMLAYWKPALREDSGLSHWPKDITRIYMEVPLGELCRYGTPECYLASRFLEHLGRPVEWTLADSWAAFRDHFGCVDHSMVDLYWHKSQSRTLLEDATLYGSITNRKELTFLDWMQIHSGQLRPEDAVDYEHVLEEPFTPLVPEFQWGPMRGSWSNY